MTTNNRIDLKDVSFLIPVRIDSLERMENLTMVLEFIKSHFDTNITVLEADTKEQVLDSNIDNKIFKEDHDPIFHRTKYLNQMTTNSSTPFLAIWDTDVLLNHRQIVDSVGLLRSENADMIFPYDGNFFNTPPLLVDMYKSIKKIKVLEENTDKLNLMFGSQAVGGAFLVNRRKYCEAGMENENFYGWGPEDYERVKRWEILEYKIRRVQGPAFHFYHPRFENSRYFNPTSKKNLLKEYLKICNMNADDLKLYTNSF